MELNELLALFIVMIALLFVWRDVKEVFLPKLINERTFQHITFAITFALFVLWSADAGVKEGLSIHFLGITALTLMYGWQSAFALSIVVALLMALFGEMTFYVVPEYLLFSCLIPILISYSVFLASYRYLPRNIFVFIFVAGFLNGGLTGTFHLVVNSAYFLIVSDYDWQTIFDNYLVFTPLLAFSEGLLNGMTASVLTVFKPGLLRVFSDRDYIYNHHHK
ncbi:energy-coupling factor ABC transporter permease [Vibrio europaeus]|uniref:energy-coupling factor ABC transporter permease n=1 Tax=Vibrio europaeus TaxID=300876 RepID=UPI0023418D0F|nr:energy-coupling factor ABC transporter permease [Vibrio europaeus]MDC5840650.1 energy-coupling factor ABC transporter permease [Vibrio europaeus]